VPRFQANLAELYIQDDLRRCRWAECF